MASVEVPPRRYLKFGGAQTVGSMQKAGSGECSKQSLPQLVGGVAREVEEQGVDLLLNTSQQCFGRHAQLSGSPLAVVGAVVAVCLPSARL